MAPFEYTAIIVGDDLGVCLLAGDARRARLHLHRVDCWQRHLRQVSRITLGVPNVPSEDGHQKRAVAVLKNSQ